jgi:hypothetical protein
MNFNLRNVDRTVKPIITFVLLSIWHNVQRISKCVVPFNSLLCNQNRMMLDLLVHRTRPLVY